MLKDAFKPERARAHRRVCTRESLDTSLCVFRRRGSRTAQVLIKSYIEDTTEHNHTYTTNYKPSAANITYLEKHTIGYVCICVYRETYSR